MTKTVKKRLQAVVALLVCFMVLFAAFPSVPFSVEVGALSAGDVIYFDTSCNEYGNLYSYGWRKSGPVYVRYTTSNIGFGSHDSVSWSNWTQLTTEATGYDPADSAAKLYEYALPVNNIKAVMFARTTQSWQNGDVTWPMEVSASNNYYYTALKANQVYGLTGSVENKAGTSYQRVKVEEKGGISDFAPQLPSDTTNRAYLAGVNYFNYYYDEQVRSTNGETQNVTQGQYKSPYAYFNQAIMANTSYMNGNDVPMYLGEYWIGSGAENPNNGSYNGQSYNADTAQNVVAGIYNRPCGVTDMSTTGNVPNARLQNFKWGANLAYRGGGEPSYHTVAQGLIDDTLSLDPTDSNYLIPTKNGKNVPYFDKNWVNYTVVDNLGSATNGVASTAPTFGTTTTTAGNDSFHHIGKVYTSTFPFYYEQEVNLTALNTNAITNGWQFGSSNLAAYHGGMSLTSNKDIKLSCYTFDSLSDTVGVNKTGGMTEDPNASQSGTIKTMYLDPAHSGDGDIVTSNEARIRIQQYLNNTTVEALHGKQVYSGTTGTVDFLSNSPYTTVNQITDLILYDHKSGFTDDEIFILTLIDYFYDPGHIRDVDGKNGFFPFNTSEDGLKELEYGFGVRLDIKFNIHQYGTEDGTNTNDSVPEIFRFTGDDDVWVFIDGKLALDMGGGHKNAIGEINFQTKQTAIIYTADADNNDTCNEWGSGDGITKLDTSQSPAVTNVLTEILNEANTNDTHISNEHTLTFFYMERGKLNSNMSLMFNFYAPEIVKIPPGEGETFPSTNPPPASDRKFSIREVTNFDHINPGLVSATKLIAEDDVFTYNVQNNTATASVTTPSNWGTERVQVPTKDIYTRTHEEVVASRTLNPPPVVATVSTNLTNGSTSTATLLPSGNYIYLDCRNNSIWNSKTYKGAYMYSSDETVKYHDLGTQVDSSTFSKVYKIPVYAGTEGGKVIFGASNDNLGTGANWFSSDPNPRFPAGVSPGMALNVGHVYVVDALGGMYDDGVFNTGSIKNFAGTANSSTYGNVANTGYVWKDDLAAKISGNDGIDGMTNQTNASGQFGLMYGTSAKESSAGFLNQFMTRNWDSANSTWIDGASTVKITQGMAKVKTTSTSATVRGTNTTNGTNNEFYVSQNDRDLNHYYTSSAVLVDNTATLNNTVMTLGYTPANDNKTGAVGDAYLYTNDMTVWVSNAPNVTDIIIHKTVTESGQEVTASGVGPFTIRVNFTKVFGKDIGTNGAYVDYEKLSYYVGTGTNAIDYNTATQYHMTADTTGVTYGTFQIYANQTVHLRGIPIDSVCEIYEVDASNPNQGFTVGADEDYLSYQFIKDNNEGRVKLNNGNLNATVNISEVDVNNDGVDDVVSITVRNEKKPSNDGLPDTFNLEIQKIWILQDKDTLTDESISNVYFRLERSADSGATWSTFIDNIVLSGTAGTATYGGTTVTTVAETKSADELTVTWKATINNLAARSGQGGTPYQYRLIEYGKGQTSVILATGGAYSANCTADYTNNTKTADNTMTPPGTAPNSTWNMVLSVSNTFSETTTTIDPKPLPKTGAAGVYAIVTFGAFAITIAGVALLIYRKKLQTVNIYAVKGSEKKKE